jgi:hypothetical protein
LPQIHRRHRHLGGDRQRRVFAQQGAHRLFAQRPLLRQQRNQRRRDPALAFLRRQPQQPHIFAIRTGRLLPRQRVVGPAKRHARIQIVAIHVAGERPRLAHQPVDHVPIVDAMLALATQTLHRLHQRAGVPHLDRLCADPQFHLLTDQTRRHRVRILLDLDRAPLAHARPLALQRVQPLPRQATQAIAFLCETLLTPRVPLRHHRQHHRPVFFPTGEVPAATQQQRLVQLLLEPPMPLLAIAILVTARRVGCFATQTIMVEQPLVLGRILFGAAFVVHRQGHAIRAVTLRHSP